MLSRAVVKFVALIALLGLPAPAVAAANVNQAALDADWELEEGSDEVSLLQRQLQLKPGSAPLKPQGRRDLAFMHIPYNFGHTVENVAMFGSSGGLSSVKMAAYMQSLGGFAEVKRQASWAEARLLTQPHGEVWGHVNPDLQLVNEATGCPMYYAPPKYWPKHLAAKYFGNKTVFGMLRDPYERLVALFRGNVKGYGGNDEFMKTCDVNGAVKKLLKEYLTGNKFAQDCTLLPQAEFFDGPYGISLPVNNRQFPASMNQVFKEHGYSNFKIQTEDILHVFDCKEVWAGDLDEETRSLVRKVYARDFELLCKHFGYCDTDENCCIWQVPDMCPGKVLKRGYRGRPPNATP